MEADYKSAAFTPDVVEQKRMQTETLSSVFETYFRVLKHVVQPAAARLAIVLCVGHCYLLCITMCANTRVVTWREYE